MTETTTRETVLAEWIDPRREAVRVGNDHFKLRLTFHAARELAEVLTGLDDFTRESWTVQCERFDIKITTVCRTGDQDYFEVSAGPVSFVLDGDEVAEWRDQLRYVVRLPSHRDDEGGGGEE
jgi:hypothetical protein